MSKNIVVISSTIERKNAVEFTKLPYTNKLIFVPKELDIKSESVFPINYNYNDDITIGMYSNNIANGGSSMIDLLSFLCQMTYNRIN